MDVLIVLIAVGAITVIATVVRHRDASNGNAHRTLGVRWALLWLWLLPTVLLAGDGTSGWTLAGPENPA
jgi:hypothetical protein